MAKSKSKRDFDQAVAEALSREAAISKAVATTAPADQKEPAGRRARIAGKIRDLWKQQGGER